MVRRALEREFSHRPRGFVVHASRNLTDAHAPRGGAEDEPARAVDVMKAREGHDATRLATHRQRQHARSPRHQPQWFRPRDEHASNTAAIAHPFESRQSTSRQRVRANRPVPSPLELDRHPRESELRRRGVRHAPRAARAQKRAIHQHRAVSSKRGEKRPLVRHREGVHAKLDDIRRGGRVRGVIRGDARVVARRARTRGRQHARAVRQTVRRPHAFARGQRVHLESRPRRERR